MVDIHSHILSEVDDGAKDIETSLKMLRIAKDAGTKSIIATPHYIYEQRSFDTDLKDLEDRFQDLKKRAVEDGNDIEIYLGAEIFIFPTLADVLKEGRVHTLNKTKYVLIELPMQIIPMFTDEVLFRLGLEGYIPIISHPERNEEIISDIKIIDSYIERGILIQIDASSILGLYSRKVKKTALKLIKQNKVHFIASDAHTCEGRNPSLKKTKEILSSMIGEEKALLLLSVNGRKLLSGEAIEDIY